jgi:hypothetical protein
MAMTNFMSASSVRGIVVGRPIGEGSSRILHIQNACHECDGWVRNRNSLYFLHVAVIPAPFLSSDPAHAGGLDQGDAKSGEGNP